MKIAVIIDSWWPIVGGGPIHVLELCKELANKYDCKIDIFTRAISDNGEKFQGKSQINKNINLYRIGKPRDFFNLRGRLAFLYEIFFKIKKRDYDLVHAHAFTSGIPGYFLKIFKGIPIIFTVHGTGIKSWNDMEKNVIKSIVLNYIERLILLKFKYSYVITVNREFLEIGGRYHKKITYINNGVRINKKNKKINRSGLLFVGRLQSQKSVDTLINAIKIVKKDFPLIKLFIIGDGPLENQLKNLSKNLELDNNIKFLGKLKYEDVKKYYSSCELLILPSIWEGQALTLLEAMSFETPILATEVQGNKELIENRFNGLLVPPKNPEKIAEGIIYSINNKNEIRKWAINGLKIVKNKYSWKEVAKKTFTVYNNVIKNE